jgi:hypothetical protein
MKAGEETRESLFPWKRDAAFDIREEFGARAARAWFRESAEEDVTGTTEITEITEDRAAGASSKDADG